MNVKLSALYLLGLGVCLGTAQAETTYTVTDNSGTRTAPTPLESLSVDIDDGSGEVVTKSFAEASQGFGTEAVFRKRGTGWVTGSTRMGTFVGEIRIEEGAYMVTTNLMTGPLNLATAPTVVVSNGATFALATTAATCPSANNLTDAGLHLYNHFRLSGIGVDEYGAIANLLENNQQYLFVGNWTLDDDATLCGRGATRYDMIGLKEQYVDLNGHTLTVKKSVDNKTWTFCPGATSFKNGHIIVRGASFQPQGGGTSWVGDASNTVTLMSGATLNFYNTSITIPYTFVVAEGTQYANPSGSKANKCGRGVTRSLNYIDGPIQLDGIWRISCSTVDKGLSLWGPVSGAGTLFFRGCWGNLLGDSPNYVGNLQAEYANGCDAGITLYSPGTVANVKEISTTDAMLELASAATPYVLPPVVASVSAGKCQEFTGGSCGSTCASLTKTGPGELKFDAPVTVTGVTDIGEGRVTIRNRKSGLIFGQSGPVGNASSLYVGEHVYTNSVQSSTHLAYQDGNSVGHSNCVVWAGYLWNREATNVNWTFAFAMNQGLVFRFDGVKKIEDYSFQQAQRSLKCTVEATPGPHYAQFRVYGSQSSGGGPTKAWHIQNMTWKDAFGIAVDKLGRDSDDLNDYEKVEDPGDGSFITVSADNVLPDLPNWTPAITNLRLRPGAELDTMGGDLALAKLDGVGTVRNATVIENRVAVNGPWTAAATQITSDKGGAFAVEKGTLAFGAGATFELAFDKRLARNTPYPIAHADGGIEGLPQLTDAMKADYWELKLSDDGKTLYLNSVKGLTIFVR